MSLFLGVLNSLIWIPITIQRKILRKRNASAMGILTAKSFAIPLWCISLLVCIHIYGFNLSRQYFAYVLLWALLVIITNRGEIFFYKFQALSEYSIYALGFSTVVSGLVDHFYFHTIFSLPTIVGIFLIFVAGLIISTNKNSQKIDTKESMKLSKILFWVFVLSIIGVIQVFLYKKGVAMQNYPIVHGVFSQLMMFPIVAILGWKRLKQDIQKKYIGVKEIVVLAGMIFVYTIIEPFVIKSLPIIIVTLLSSVRLVVYALYDMRGKEFKTKRKVIIALLLVVCSLCLIRF